jgi:hypothetical protein
MAKNPPVLSTKLPVTREARDGTEVEVVLKVPQSGAIPMGVVMPIDAENDSEFNELLDKWRLAKAEHECLDANSKALEAAFQELRRQCELSLERVVSKRSAFEQYLDKNLKKDHNHGENNG